MSYCLDKKTSSTYIVSIELTHLSDIGDCLSIDLNADESNNNANLNVPLVWFRDHCRSPRTYNQSTHQPTSKMLNILEEAQISGRSAVSFNGNKLSIDWRDGHKSVFDSDLLVKMLVKPAQIKPQDLYHLWIATTIGNIPTMHTSAFSFPDFARTFVKFGCVAVEGIEPTIEATDKFVREIAPIHGTHYKDVWAITTDEEEQDPYHQDVAWTNGDLGSHTDGPHYVSPPGLMSFHVVRPADEGGETGLVDGFKAAERLKIENPSAFNILTKTLIDHHLIETGDTALLSFAGSRPVIQLNPYGGYEQIRFDPPDRAPLRLSLNGENGLSLPQDVFAFYTAYQAFARICNDPSMVVRMMLKPGTILFFDNFRVLHSRTAYTGNRKLLGCYLSRDYLMAKARLQLEENIRLQV